MKVPPEDSEETCDGGEQRESEGRHARRSRKSCQPGQRHTHRYVLPDTLVPLPAHSPDMLGSGQGHHPLVGGRETSLLPTGQITESICASVSHF